MNKQFFTTLLFNMIFFQLIVFAQNYEWSHTYFMIGGADKVNNVFSSFDSNKNLIITGSRSIFTDYPFMFWFSKDGNLFLESAKGSEGRITDLLVDENNNVFTCGSEFNAFTPRKIEMVVNKSNTDSPVSIWNFTLPIKNQLNLEEFVKYASTKFTVKKYNSNLIGCGISLNRDSLSDLNLFNLDEDGNEVWTEYYANSPNYYIFPLELDIDKNGNIFVCVYSENADSSNTFFVKYDINGNLKWDKLIMNTKAISLTNYLDPNSKAASIIIVNNNPWIALNTEDKKFLLQFDSLGNVLNSFERTTDKKILGINKDQENNVYEICADSLYKYNEEGKLIKSTELPGNLTYTFYDFDRYNNIYIVAKKSHFFTAKINRNLQIEWSSDTKIPDKPNFHNESFVPYSIVGSTDKGVFVTGVSRVYDSTDFNGDNYLVTVKLSDFPNDVKNNVSNINKFYLSQNYPNPFNPTTIISYTIPNDNNVSTFTRLTVFIILGKQVATLVNEKQSPGNYQVEFDGSDLPSGVYFYRLQTGTYSVTKKMVLLR